MVLEERVRARETHGRMVQLSEFAFTTGYDISIDTMSDLKLSHESKASSHAISESIDSPKLIAFGLQDGVADH
jgi:hypothetical protein